MKNKIIDYHTTKGYITFKDLINDIELISQDYKEFESIVIDMLKDNNCDDKIIALLVDNDIANRLDNISYVLRDRLWRKIEVLPSSLANKPYKSNI